MGAFPFVPFERSNTPAFVSLLKFRFILSIQFLIVSSDSLPLNRRPDFHSAPVARRCRSVSLDPIPLECEVQNGTMVLPVRSWLSRKVKITFGALPHQMG